MFQSLQKHLGVQDPILGDLVEKVGWMMAKFPRELWDFWRMLDKFPRKLHDFA